MSEALVRKTHFTLSEIERLLGVYREHSEQIDAMHRNNFRLFELLLLIQTLIMVTILLLSWFRTRYRFERQLKNSGRGSKPWVPLENLSVICSCGHLYQYAFFYL